MDLPVINITRIVKSSPRILLISGDTVLLPKLEFISSIGFTGAERTNLITTCPSILYHSLHNTIIPSYNALKRILTSDEIVLCLKRSAWLLNLHVQKYLAAKVSILNSYGAPEGQIKRLVKFAPRAVVRANDKFDEIVKRVIGMGFDPAKSNFISAIDVICQLQESTWEQKIEVYKSLGWSEDEILLAFRMFPSCMQYSANKIRSAMEFYVNKLDLQPSSIAKTPNMLGYSLEKRIKPRCSVITVLMSKGVLRKENISYASILVIGDEQFMDKFVIKYCKDVPQLLSVFKGKSGCHALGSSYKLA